MSTADQVGSVSIPDVAPSSVESLSRFSMCAGDFLEAYHEPGELFSNFFKYIYLSPKGYASILEVPYHFNCLSVCLFVMSL